MRDQAAPRARLKKLGMLTALASLPAMAGVVFTAGSASAHGAPLVPGSRTYLCYAHSLDDTGAVNPTNPACRAAMEASGANGFYNWFAVLRSDGGGRTEGFIPDGQLCSGAAEVYDFSGFDLARDDWPVTHLTAGATMEFRYSNWAAHPGSFRSYITNDTYDPNESLTWDNLEDEPFDEVTDPPAEGGPGTDEGGYYWDATLPSDVTGRHIIYTVWERSDSEETFYSCSDVVFDGGNGEVTVPGQGTLSADEMAEAAAAVEESTPAVDHAHEAESAAATGEHAGHAGHTTPSQPARSTASATVLDAARQVLPSWIS
jgi:predicted carbohydrate-binding protein with CBM5 and CBM33 domain